MFKDCYSLPGEIDVMGFSGYGYLFMNYLKSFGHSMELLRRVDRESFTWIKAGNRIDFFAEIEEDFRAIGEIVFTGGIVCGYALQSTK
jgi:hypothetical protein